MPSPKKLGKHLEWHGNRIRVVIREPPSMLTKIGKGTLKENGPSATRLLARFSASASPR